MSKNKNKLIVFDLDGTLIDSFDDIYDSLVQTLEIYSLKKYDKDYIRKAIGYGFNELVKSVLPTELFKETDYVENFVLEYRKIYSSNCYNKTHVYEGIRDLLNFLLNRNIIISVLSNKADFFVKNMVDYYFPRIHFFEVLGSTERFLNKPSPDSVLYLIDKAEVEQRNTCLIGDSEVDIQTAKNAGITSVGVTWGFRNKNELKKIKPNFLVDLPKEIPKVLDL